MLSNQEFKDRWRQFLAAGDLTFLEAARKLVVKPSTLSSWTNKGIFKDTSRQKIVDRFPQVFSGLPIPQPKESDVVQFVPRKVTLGVKIELTRQSVVNVNQLLRWFLLEATVDERNRLRDELGADWKRFLNYSRAMTNETAFGMVREEGLLNGD